jgi:hypothetical protein
MVFNAQALVSFKKYMPPPLPYYYVRKRRRAYIF